MFAFWRYSVFHYENSLSLLLENVFLSLTMKTASLSINGIFCFYHYKKQSVFTFGKYLVFDNEDNMPSHKINSTLSEQFQGPMEKNDRKGKIIHLTAHFPGLV